MWTVAKYNQRTFARFARSVLFVKSGKIKFNNTSSSSLYPSFLLLFFLGFVLGCGRRGVFIWLYLRSLSLPDYLILIAPLPACLSPVRVPASSSSSSSSSIFLEMKFNFSRFYE
jgi:hypothetical protein